MKTFKELREKTLTPAEKKKREEIAKAMEKDNPDMPMDKKMAIATATAKRVAEEKSVRQLIDPKKEVMVVKMNGKRHKVIVIDKSKQKEYLSKGWMLAEEVELDEAKDEKYDSDKFFGGKGTPEQRTQLLKLQNKALKALGGSPMQKAIKKDIDALRKKMGMKVSESLEEQKDDAEYNDEGGMAISQLKTAKSAVEELMSIIKDNDNLPEWVQSKLTKAVDYMDSVRDYMASEKGEVQEAVKTTHVVIDTANGNKVVATASDEKGAKSSVASAERPPMNIKNKKTLKIVKLKRPVGDKQVDRMVGYPLKEAVSPAQQAAIAIAKKEKGEKPKEESRAYRDAMRGMKGNTKGMATTKKDKDTEASDDDRKAASKNIIMQLRKAADLTTGANIDFEKGKGKVDRATAQRVIGKFNSLRKPIDKEKFQNSIKSLADIKKILGR